MVDMAQCVLALMKKMQLAKGSMSEGRPRPSLPVRLWTQSSEFAWMLGVGLFLVLGSAAGFAPALGGQRFPYGADTVTHDYILHAWGWQTVMVGRGEWPLWSPHLFSGLPFLASFSLCPFYPTGWLQFLLPMPVAFTLQYVLALAVGGWGMVRVGRVLGLGRTVSLAMGLALMGSGHFLTLVHAGHLQKMIAVAWSPWVLAGALGIAGWGRPRTHAERGFLDAWLGRPGSWLLLTVALAMQLLASHAQIFYSCVALALLLVFPWGVVWPSRMTAHLGSVLVLMVAALVRVGLAAGVSIGLAAGQMLPALELAPLSNRGGGVPYAEAVATSYPPLELQEYVIPSVFGDSIRGSAVGYFGNWGERIVSDFLGVGMFVLAILGWVALRHGVGITSRASSPAINVAGLQPATEEDFCGQDGRTTSNNTAREEFPHQRLGGRRAGRLAWLLAAGFLLSLLVGLGRYTPLYIVLWATVPGFSSYRSPGSFMFVANLMVIVLAGLGAQSLWRGSWKAPGPLLAWRTGLVSWLPPTAIVLGVGLLAVALYENLGVRLDLATPQEARRWKLFFGAGILGIQLVVCALVILAVWRTETQRLRGILVGGLALFILGMQVGFNSRYVRFDPLAPYLAYLNQESWRAASRPGKDHSPMPGEWPRILEQNDLLLGAVVHDAGVPLGYHPISLARVDWLRELVPHHTAAFASLMAINFARTYQDQPPAAVSGEFRRVARQSAPSPVFLWRRVQPFSPLRQGVQVRAAADYQEAAALVAEASKRQLFSTQAVVVAEDLERVPAMQEGPQLSLDAELRWQGSHRARLRLGARPTAPVVLPMAIPYAPGWHARDLNGAPLPLIPADLATLAVVLPVGATGATLHYAPFSFRLGVFLMLLAGGVILVVAARRFGLRVQDSGTVPGQPARSMAP
jgi:hypothetical protein